LPQATEKGEGVDTEPTAERRAGGLQTALDTLIAPNDAYARLRETPTWGWAYLIAVALAMLAALALVPALHHALAVALPAQVAAMPSIAKLPPGEQQAAIARIVSVQTLLLNVTWLSALAIVPLTALIQALVMLAANAIGRGDGTFRRFWALAMNVQVAGSIGGLILAAIVLLRGAASFSEPGDIQRVIPSLGMLLPGAPHVLVAFFSAFNVAAIWQAVLLALGMIAAARIPRPVAWSTALVMLLFLGTIGALGAAAQPHAG
jgi:hypothetical protein